MFDMSQLLGNLKNMPALIEGAKKMQEKMNEMNASLATKTTQAMSGGGMVKVTANGKQEIVAIDIEPSLIETKDAKFIQDLIIAATNTALHDSKEMAAREMQSLTGGLDLGSFSELLKK